MEKILRIFKLVIPKRLFRALQPAYHGLLATLGALWYRFPSKSIYIIGVTGTKGKSTVVELISAILEEAGHTVAFSNTIRFKIADESKPNLYKMSMPGRFFMQRFLRNAVQEDCGFAVLEMTSEGAAQNRHKHIEIDALVFTNLSPEHIESHGSFEAYRDAKLLLKDALISSQKEERKIIANKDDAHGHLFLEVPDDVQKYPYSLKQAEPYATNERGILLTYDNVSIHSPLPGLFNIYNIVAGITFARSIGIPLVVIKKAIEKLSVVKGRVERINEGQRFGVIVDYAHTTDSLEKLYKSFPEAQKICVLGNCGGGRDTKKRPEMARVAEEYCREIILTNEDPYDENPVAIIEDMKKGLETKEATIILDRRLAIRHALGRAKEHDLVLITGKGTDPYIMGPHGEKELWSDEKVAREELQKLLNKTEKDNTSGN
jgi:UDP-N-acetylmuramoyl-L-alanyl-D-glutamate--2,6-diaminopimelate ligase